jgi:hypothetical protein
MEKILTNKGKPGLIVDGYKYRMDKENKSTHLWRCVKRSCNARCKTDVKDLMIIDNQRMDHSLYPSTIRPGFPLFVNIFSMLPERMQY